MKGRPISKTQEFCGLKEKIREILTGCISGMGMYTLAKRCGASGATICSVVATMPDVYEDDAGKIHLSEDGGL